MTTSQFKTLLVVPSGPLEIPVCPTDQTAGNGSCPMSKTLQPVRFSLVIPTYNEGQNVQEIVRLLSQLLDGVIPGEYELIVVDDDSPDRTRKFAEELIGDYPQLRVMRRVFENKRSNFK